MSNTNTGGPAFPTHLNLTQGMTLRDYFAAKAMQEFLDEVGSQSDQAWFDQIAKNAYRMADTMLKARQA